jgi:hypothetical protein
LRCHFNSQLNTKRKYITDVERSERDKLYRGDNKDKISEQKKQYYEVNKKKIEYQKTYYNNKKNKTDSSSDDLTECITH